MEAVSVLVAVFVILILAWYAKRRYGKNIPGPMGLPIVGYLPFMTRKPFVKLAELGQKYGPIYRLRLGSLDVVVLCDFNVIKDAFVRDDFIGRPPDLTPFIPTEDSRRTGAISGMPWKEQKRLSLHRLRDLGFGKTRMEGHLKEEVEELLQRMTEISKGTVRMSDLLASSTSNNVASFLFGNRLKYDDPRRQKLDEIFDISGKLAGALTIQIFLPWLKPIISFFNIGNPKKYNQANDDLKDFIRKEIQDHEKTLDPNNIRDFVDAYLIEIQKRENDPNTTFTRDILTDVSGAFFGGGSETVRVVVDWLLLLCAAHPELQKKIHQEIDTVLGTERFPSYQDRNDMPYTDACICEVMRWRTTLPLNFLRYTLNDTEVKGYFIPKHTHVLAVPHAIDHNEGLWGEDHEVYKPERFLSEDGKKVVKPEHFIPFSIGKRSCPGKSLAEIEVFVYVAAILQKFEFSLPPGNQADFEGYLGLGQQPRRQELCIKLRH